MEQISIGSNLYVPAEKFGFRPNHKDGMRGYLHKQGHNVKNWKLRYFVLESDAVRYYIDETLHQLRGEWKLSKTSIARIKDSSIDDRGNLIELMANRFSGEKDTLILSARSPDEQKNWLNAITEKINGSLIEVNQPDLWAKFHVEFYTRISFYGEEPESKCVTVDNGNIVDVADAVSAPRVSLPSMGLGKHPFYCFAMIDMDFPSRSDFNRRPRLLQLRINISDSDAVGHEALPYECPVYTDPSLHRIFFVVFPQIGHLNSSNFSPSFHRDPFIPTEFATRFGLLDPVAIDGCYFANKAIAPKPEPAKPETPSQDSTPPQKKQSKKFKYYSQHARRASLTLDSVGRSAPSTPTNGDRSFPHHPDSASSTNSSALSSPLGEVSKITQLTDDAVFDDYLALPVPPGDISRDTSAASTTTKESKRVSFVSSSISLAADGSGTPTKLVSALKRPGSKRLQSKKTVSFHANEVKYVITTIPDEVEMDVYDADDVPDYDIGGGNTNNTRSRNVVGHDSPPFRHSPKSISVNTSRMVSGMADSIPDDSQGHARPPLSPPERSSSFHLGTTNGAAPVGIAHTPSLQLPSSDPQPAALSPEATQSSPVDPAAGSASSPSDVNTMCRLLGVTNQRIFSGGECVAWYCTRIDVRGLTYRVLSSVVLCCLLLT